MNKLSNHPPKLFGQYAILAVAVIVLVGIFVYGRHLSAVPSDTSSGDFGPTLYHQAIIQSIVSQGINSEVYPPEMYPAGVELREIVVKIVSTQEIVEIGVQEAEAALDIQEGDKVIVSATPRVDGSTLYGLVDKYRITSLLVIFAVLVLLLILFAGINGITSLAGLIFSILVLGWFVVPQILAGHNPLLISVVGSFIIALLSIYLSHGFSRRTSIAVAGTMITILLAVGLAYLFVAMASLTGNGSEAAFYLTLGSEGGMNLRGLLLGGIIIGTLGVLDDITTTQSAVVDELHSANPKLSVFELYHRGFSVGKEHIISLVNTLALAYIGAALPLMLLFVTSSRPAWIIINSQLVSEEIVRTLVGSIALVLAVPITTYLAARILSGVKRR
ncbi:YibE/F family protein [Patescibacteria group bacterium]|nr:YibE/F family protein [Patescibacteria group bacterium]